MIKNAKTIALRVITTDKISDNTAQRDRGIRHFITIVEAKIPPATMVKTMWTRLLVTKEYSARQIFLPILYPPFYETYENTTFIINDLFYYILILHNLQIWL